MTSFPKIDLSVLDGPVGDQKAEQKTGQTTDTDRTEFPDEPDWTSLRKAAPLKKLLDSTLRWAENLPPEVKPQALMAQYPRLANMAAASWAQPSAFRDYLDVLLVDRRGNRKGFSPDILSEFEQLRTYYFSGWYRAKSGISIYRDGLSDESRFMSGAAISEEGPPDALRLK